MDFVCPVSGIMEAKKAVFRAKKCYRKKRCSIVW
jgi:hypothetical protein